MTFEQRYIFKYLPAKRDSQDSEVLVDNGTACKLFNVVTVQEFFVGHTSTLWN